MPFGKVGRRCKCNLVEGKGNRRKRSASAAAPREKKEEIVKEEKKKNKDKSKESKKQRGNTDTSIHCHEESTARSLKDNNSHRG